MASSKAKASSSRPSSRSSSPSMAKRRRITLPVISENDEWPSNPSTPSSSSTSSTPSDSEKEAAACQAIKDAQAAIVAKIAIGCAICEDPFLYDEAPDSTVWTNATHAIAPVSLQCPCKKFVHRQCLQELKDTIADNPATPKYCLDCGYPFYDDSKQPPCSDEAFDEQADRLDVFAWKTERNKDLQETIDKSIETQQAIIEQRASHLRRIIKKHRKENDRLAFQADWIESQREGWKKTPQDRILFFNSVQHLRRDVVPPKPSIYSVVRNGSIEPVIDLPANVIHQGSLLLNRPNAAIDWDAPIQWRFNRYAPPCSSIGPDGLLWATGRSSNSVCRYFIDASQEKDVVLTLRDNASADRLTVAADGTIFYTNWSISRVQRKKGWGQGRQGVVYNHSDFEFMYATPSGVALLIGSDTGQIATHVCNVQSVFFLFAEIKNNKPILNVEPNRSTYITGGLKNLDYLDIDMMACSDSIIIKSNIRTMLIAFVGHPGRCDSWVFFTGVHKQYQCTIPLVGITALAISQDAKWLVCATDNCYLHLFFVQRAKTPLDELILHPVKKQSTGNHVVRRIQLTYDTMALFALDHLAII
jgi:hypothetical protein